MFIKGIQTKPQPREVSFPLELSMSAENGQKVHGLLEEYRQDSNKPRCANVEFREKIDSILGSLERVIDASQPGRSCPTNEVVFKAINDLIGELNKVSVKYRNDLSEQEKLELPERSEYRRYASARAAHWLTVFPVPTNHPPTPEQFKLNERFVNTAKIAQGSHHPLLEYGRALIDSLQDKSTTWNSVNIVTALDKLKHVDPRWYTRAIAPALGELLINKLANVADHQTFNAFSISNLAEAAPSLINVLGRLNPRNPILEKRLFRALNTALEYLQSKPEESYADKSFLYPLRDVHSPNLTNEGAAALGVYVAKLNHLFSQVSYAKKIGTIAATFHAMNGVSSWAFNPDSDAKLTIMLTNLNDRLHRAVGEINSVAAGSIIYGLKGLDIPSLSKEAVTQIARTIRIVTEKLKGEQPRLQLNLKAISSIAHGLTVALESKDPSIEKATKDLLMQVETMLPSQVNNFEQLGIMCGALVTLHPHRMEHRGITHKLLSRALVAAEQPLSCNPFSYSDCISWQTVQQAFALYGIDHPQELARTLETVAPFAHSSNPTNAGEERVKEWLRSSGLTIQDTRYVDGFEVDILIQNTIDIEIDGRHHNAPTQRIADKQRDAYLSSKASGSLRVVRISNDASQGEVLEMIAQLKAEGLLEVGNS